MKKILLVSILVCLTVGIFIFNIFSKPDHNDQQLIVKINDISTPDINTPNINSANSPKIEAPNLSTIIAIEDEKERQHQLTQYFNKAMLVKPLDAIKGIEQLKNQQYKEYGYQFALLAWSNSNLDALLNWLQKLEPNPIMDSALLKLIDAHSSDITLAVEIAEQISDMPVRVEAISNLATRWAESNPQEALLWAFNATKQENNQWIELVMDIFAKNDIAGAISALSQFDGADQEKIHTAIQMIINRFDPGLLNANTLASIESLTPEDMRALVIGALLPLLIASELLSLNDLDRLIGQLAPGDIKDQLYQDLASSWVYEDPQEAIAYANSLSGITRDVTINAVIANWMVEDLEATDAWLGTLDENIDIVSDTLGRGAAEQSHIEISDKWLDAIENNEMRTKASIDVVRSYYNDDVAAGIYHLVYQKNISTQIKLNILHELYPNEVFITPREVLDELGRLEGLRSAIDEQQPNNEPEK